MRIPVLVFALAVTASRPAVAAAAVPPGYQLRLEVGTDFPVALGARVSAEFPLRLRVGSSLGALVGPYVDSINGVVVALGGYPQSTADLISDALQNSLVWRLQVGWRPFASLGFYVDLGYGLATLGGGATGDQILAAALGQSAPANSGGRDYDIVSTIHLVMVEIGWQWSLWHDRISLRAAVGGAFTVAASTTITPQFSTTSALEGRLVEAFTTFGEDYLDDTYTTYVHTPVISVAAGYRFF